VSLGLGTRIGVYEIVAPLGAGGMGEVYRARDTKLNRDVAIKVLLPSVANDPDRLARFSREAQVLASLNHPNIAHIHGLEESGGVTALVMELVEGEDLSQRITRGAIPVDEALPIARQIAEALEAAHDLGIIHRDLKPANIKVRPDGAVKVLDFGLAKAVDPTAGSSATAMNSPTLSIHATEAGIILGTAAYMSPEQAAGKSVDKRSDLWAFGVVLLEMLTGHQLFEGESVSHVMAAVLKDEPDWSRLPTETPASIRRLLRRCLEKDRRRRSASAADACLDVDDAINRHGPGELPSPSNVRRAVWPLSIGIVVAGIAVGGALLFSRSGSEAAPSQDVIRFAISDSDRMFVSALDGDVALSPDGRSLAFVGYGEGAPRIWVRAIDAIEARPLPGTESAAFLSWSPDSRSIAFSTGARIKRVALAGGAPQVLAPGRNGPLAWGADGFILSANSRGVWRVKADDGTGTNVLPITTHETYPSAETLPDGRHMLVSVQSADAAKAGTFAISIDGATRTRVLDFPTKARYSRGHLLYGRDGVLYAQAFDVSNMRVHGETTKLAEASSFSVSGTGAIAYVRQSSAGGATTLTQLAWMDRAGHLIGRIDQALGGTRPALSPDGRRLAMVLRNAVWVLELNRDVLSRVTVGEQANPASWFPDSERLLFTRPAFRNAKDAVFATGVGGGNEESVLDLTNSADDHAHPTDVSLDGRHLLYEGGPEAYDIRVMSLTGDKTSRAIAEGPAIETQGTVSPDGAWVAYSSDSSGRFEIFAQPFPDGGPRIQVSAEGGSSPHWRRDGKELFYMAADGTLIAVPISRGANATIEFGRPVRLFRFFSPVKGTPAGKPPYDVSADGQRFIVSAVVRQVDPVLHVVLNWPALTGSQTP
jgi:serine/threonine protein kinase/Tol biopolymer transport system component